jgi:hypothetical protein
MVLKYKFNNQIKWGILLSLVYIYVFPNMYAMMTLDYTGYAHIAHQLSVGNWAALFNLTWSSLMSLFASLLIRIGLDVHISFAIIKSLFIILTFRESNLFINTNFKDDLSKKGLKIIFLCLIFFLSTSNTDILFFYFTISVVNAFIKTKNIKFTINCILLILTRPLGLYLVFFILFIDLVIRKINIVNRFISYYNYALIFTFVLIWSITLGRYNGLAPTMGWAGKYNLTLVSPDNQRAYSLNYDEKYKQLADVYHDHMIYTNNSSDSSFHSAKHDRRIDQWKWLDISFHVGKSIKEFNFRPQKNIIIHFVKWYTSNFYIFFKEYLFLLITIYFLLKEAKGNRLKIISSIFIICFLYLSMFFVTHIETRYILTPIVILISTVIYFNDRKWFNNFQYLLVFNLFFFKQWIQIILFFASGLQNLTCKVPYFLNQKFDQKVKYVSTGNLPPSLLVIKNENLKCVGYIKSRDDYWKITDSTIALLEFKSDTAYFTFK